MGRRRQRRAAPCAAAAQGDDRLRQPVPAHDPPRGGARYRGGRCARLWPGSERRGRARRQPAREPEHPGKAVASAARNLLGRRAAAHQHRPRLRGGTPDPAVGRADGIARCGQPGGGGRVHPRPQADRRRPTRNLPRRRREVARSPIASSMSPALQLERIAHEPQHEPKLHHRECQGGATGRGRRRLGGRRRRAHRRGWPRPCSRTGCRLRRRPAGAGAHRAAHRSPGEPPEAAPQGALAGDGRGGGLRCADRSLRHHHGVRTR